MINEGCRLFHAGKKRPEQYQLALALSEPQGIALDPWLDQSLTRYSKGCGLHLPDALIHAGRDNFFTPYRQSGHDER